MGQYITKQALQYLGITNDEDLNSQAQLRALSSQGSNPDACLMGLPTELRFMIFSHLTRKVPVHIGAITSEFARLETLFTPSLLRVNQQLRREFHQIYPREQASLHIEFQKNSSPSHTFLHPVWYFRRSASHLKRVMRCEISVSWDDVIEGSLQAEVNQRDAVARWFWHPQAQNQGTNNAWTWTPTGKLARKVDTYLKELRRYLNPNCQFVVRVDLTGQDKDAQKLGGMRPYGQTDPYLDLRGCHRFLHQRWMALFDPICFAQILRLNYDSWRERHGIIETAVETFFELRTPLWSSVPRNVAALRKNRLLRRMYAGREAGWREWPWVVLPEGERSREEVVWRFEVGREMRGEEGEEEEEGEYLYRGMVLKDWEIRK